MGRLLRPAPARALLGPSRLAGHLHGVRPHGRRLRAVPSHRSARREVVRAVGVHPHRGAHHVRGARLVRRRRRAADRRLPRDADAPGVLADRRGHPDDRDQPLRLGRGARAGRGDGRDRGDEGGDGPARRGAAGSARLCAGQGHAARGARRHARAHHAPRRRSAGARVARAHRSRADEEVAARSRRLGDDGVRGGDRARSDVPQLLGTGRRHGRAALRLRGRGPDRRGSRPHGHHREDAGHRGPGHAERPLPLRGGRRDADHPARGVPRRRHSRHDPRHGHDRRHGGLVRPHGGPRPGLTDSNAGDPGRLRPLGRGCGRDRLRCAAIDHPADARRLDAVRSRDVRRRGEDPPRRGRADPRGGGRVEDARASFGGSGAAAHAGVRAARGDPVRRGGRADGAVVVHGR
ncbi:putative Uncharacterized 50.6 kDa protein in the 5'region of gyrA and gyrB [Microbacterium sp. 8M]|nr:putative Uncharacterized 50.6 kDa protein in the 5'region of gyrA and gyrB [Microbacterium sp. 8M]